MVVGARDDYYQVDNIGDNVNEGAGAGSGADRVDSSVTFTLGDNDEKTKVRKSMESELTRLPRTQQLSIYCTFHL